MRTKMLLQSMFFLLLCFHIGTAYAKKIDIKPIEKSHFIYYYDNTQYIPFSDSVLMESCQKMIQLLKDSIAYKPSVYLLNNLDDFNSLVGGKFPDWGIGVALPLKKMIVIKSPDSFNLNKSLQQLLAHEFAHLAVAHKSFLNEPPRWLNEGIAMYVSMEWSWSDNVAMGKAGIFGQFIKLQDIELVNRFYESKAQIAYAESYLAVKFMLKHYGTSSVRIFLEQISRNKSVDDAMYFATGSSMEEFQNDFNISLHKQFNYASLFMDTMFFWIALAIIVVYAFFLQYKKRRAYYKKWEEEEKLQSTDFDYGNSDNPEQIEDDDEAWRQ